jgi:hypothetical protein
MNSVSEMVDAIRRIDGISRTISRRPPTYPSADRDPTHLADHGTLTAQGVEDFSHGDFGEFDRSEMTQRVREKGTEALAYYVSFHDLDRYNSGEWGIYILESGLIYLAAHLQRAFYVSHSAEALGAAPSSPDDLELPWYKAVDFAREALLYHEIFHFEADCVSACWESLLQRPCWALHHDRVQSASPRYDTTEEALANAHMYRSVKGCCRGSAKWLRELIANSPEGYRDAFDHTGENEFRIGLNELSRRYAALPMAASGLSVGGCTLDASRLYELDIEAALSQCPVRVVLDAESKGLRPLGLGFISKLPAIEETERFKRRLSKCPEKIQEEWHSYRSSLNVAVPRPPKFKKFRDCYSLALSAVNGGYRAHLVPVGGFQKWRAIDIGDHLEMGHGK